MASKHLQCPLAQMGQENYWLYLILDSKLIPSYPRQLTS